MTFTEWEAIARRMFGAFPHVNLTPETVLVYFEELAEFDADIVLGCVRRCIETSRYLPSIAELRGLAVPEQQVRREWDAAPDFTNFDALPEPEQVRRLEQGLRRSIEIEQGDAARPSDPPRPELPA